MTGAKWAGQPSVLAADVDCVITCLPSPAISEKVLAQLLSQLEQAEPAQKKD